MSPLRGSRAAKALFMVVTVLGLGLVLETAPPSAANVVNVTFHVPASVVTNPCFPADVVNLNGDIHVVITATADKAGGYRTDNHLNSELRGVSITSGTSYTNSEDKDDTWYARAPFPASTPRPTTSYSSASPTLLTTSCT